MNKHRIRTIVPVAILVVALVLCGTVLAYMFRQTEYEDNSFTPANVSCEVAEEFDGVQKKSIKVQNTGNIDAYLRVRLVSYWVDSAENIVAKPSPMPEITLAEGWIKGSDNTYYYPTAVAQNGFTGELLSEPILLEKNENGYLQVVEVFAEAIQSKPANAVQTSWNVSMDSNANITAAS